MQPTGDFDHEIPNNGTPEANGILDHAAALDATIDVLDAYALLGYGAIVGFLRWGERATTRLFDRLVDGDPIQGKATKAQILEQVTSGGQGIGTIIGNIFVMHPPFKGRAQEDNLQGSINHQRIFQGMIFGLPTVVERLFVGVGRARNRALGRIMAKKGAGYRPAVDRHPRRDTPGTWCRGVPQALPGCAWAHHPSPGGWPVRPERAYAPTD